MQHVAAADGVAGDERDDHLGHRADEFLDFKDIESRHAFAVDVAPWPRTDWSPPEQKAYLPSLAGPAPVRKTTPIPWSSRASSRASCNSATVWGRKALRFSGG